MPEDVLADAETQWAPPDHPVFQLVPPDFETFVTLVYETHGRPVVQMETFWDIYTRILQTAEYVIEAEPNVAEGLNRILDAHAEAMEFGENQGIPIITHVQEAEFGLNGLPALQEVEDVIAHEQLEGNVYLSFSFN